MDKIKQELSAEQLERAKAKLQEFKDLKIQESKDLKFGFSTREVEKMGKDSYYIHCFLSGWQTAEVTEQTLFELLTGEQLIFNLNWQ